MANFCIECGFKLEEDWINCPKCGASLNPYRTQITSSASIFTCRKCGTKITEQQFNNFNGFCSECKRLEPISKAADLERKSDILQWIIGGCIIIFGICVAIYMFFFYQPP